MRNLSCNVIIETPTDDMIKRTEIWKNNSYFRSQYEGPCDRYFNPHIPKESLDDKITVIWECNTESTFADFENQILKPHSKSNLPGTFYLNSGHIWTDKTRRFYAGWSCRKLWISQYGVPYWFRLVSLNNTIHFKTFYGEKIMSVRMTRDKSVRKFVKEATKQMYKNSIIRFIDPIYYGIPIRGAFYHGYHIKNSRRLQTIHERMYHDYNMSPIGSYENPLIVDSWIPALSKNFGEDSTSICCIIKH